MGKVNKFMFFSLAPLLGVLLALNFSFRPQAFVLSMNQAQEKIQDIDAGLHSLQNRLAFINTILVEQEKQYQLQLEQLLELAEKSQEQRDLSDEVYDARILAKLGPPLGEFASENVVIQVFELREIGYRGYIAKIKLLNVNSLQVVLGKDSLGSTETTKSAVMRKGAILGVNGGGFYQSFRDGRPLMLPLGNTVINNKLQQPFTAADEELSFAGVNIEGELMGGYFATEAELLKSKPWQGVSFLPTLIKNAKPTSIPVGWQKQRHPRTIMGRYGNDDLVLIVVDGRQAGWSQGVTLEEMQLKLLDLGVREAYNLDGGGSTTFVFAEKVLNRPSDGSERPVATNIVILP